MTNQSFPPPPGGGTPGYEPGYGAPMGGGEHPEGQKLLILSIVGLVCCAPLNIWVLIKANGIMKTAAGYDTSKVNTAKIIAIVSLVLWVAGIVINMFTGALDGVLDQTGQ